jgi:hypothetical protein
MLKEIHTHCQVCGRSLKSEKAKRRGAGDTCFANSFERSIPEWEQENAMKSFKLLRLEDLRKAADLRRNKGR